METLSRVSTGLPNVETGAVGVGGRNVFVPLSLVHRPLGTWTLRLQLFLRGLLHLCTRAIARMHTSLNLDYSNDRRKET